MGHDQFKFVNFAEKLPNFILNLIGYFPMMGGRKTCLIRI